MNVNGTLGRGVVDDVVETIPRSFQYPDVAEARVHCDTFTSETDAFEPLDDRLVSRTETRGGTPIRIEVVYLEDRPPEDQGPFLAEEQTALDTYAELLRGYLEREGALGSSTDTEVESREPREPIDPDRQLGEEYDHVLDRMSDVFTALDTDWRITYLNEGGRRAIVSNLEEDLSKEELIGRHFWSINPEFTEDEIAETALYQSCHEAMERQEVVAHEKYYENEDFWVHTEVYPSDTGVSIISRDITERKKYERKLEESNERLEQFAYAASHDLQEPLRTVSNYLQLIEDRYAGALDEDGREFLEFAVNGADRMREMIDSLLEFSRIERQGEPFEPVDLNGVLEQVLEDIRFQIEEHDAEVTADELPRVRGDPGQLRQVVQNLLSNAIEYRGDEPPRVHVSAERDGTDWLVSVRDEGIGIDPGDADRIFDVFQRLHTHGEHPGTGIGLALCERIVERHGGDIWVDSEPGEGATFTFTLPVAGESGS